MDLLVGLFVTGLYQAVEKIWEKSFDAAWEPIDSGLKERFNRLAGKGTETERKKAFARASEKARRLTVKGAKNPQEADAILAMLNRDVNLQTAAILAEEASKVLLFAEEPDLERMIEVASKQIKWEALLKTQPIPPPETIGLVLHQYLNNLRLAMMDESSYRDLIQHEMLRALQKSLQKSADNVHYDGEAEYVTQLVERFQYLDFVGIPELKDRQALRIEDLFVHLQTEID